MDNYQSLILNEETLAQISVAKRSEFLFGWLCFLDKALAVTPKNDIKECQKKLVEQLVNHMQESPGPPVRKLIARSLATLFSIGDTFLLFDTVNKCNDILKNKDDSPHFLPTRLTAICCLGTMYEKLGRMMGRSYEDTVQILLKFLRNTESQTRIEILITLEKVCRGMGSAVTNIHKDIYKAVRHCFIDRVMAVRCAASRCILEMLNHSPFLYTSELESLASLCFRAFDGSNYEVRYAVAKLLGTLIAMTQQTQQLEKSQTAKHLKSVSLDEALGILMLGFLRGGVGFLKGTGEIIKGSSSVNKEVRVGVTHAYVMFAQMLGGLWLEKNMKQFLTHVLYLVANPKAATSHVDAVYSRKCVNFILRSVLGKMLSEKAQASACREIILIVIKEMNSIDFNPENAKEFNQETLFCQHLLVCALHEVGSLVLCLGTTAHDLITDYSLNLISAVVSVLMHPCQAARLAAAWCLRCICIAVPLQITPLISQCLCKIEEFHNSPDAVSGYSCALVAVLGGVPLSPLGIPHNKGKIIFNNAEELLRTASQNSRLSLNRTQAGWLLIGAIMRLGVPVVRSLLPRMLLLWRNSFPKSEKELESEKARGDAFTWQVTLQGRAGALSSIHSFLLHCPDLITDDIVRKLLASIESALVMLTNISSILKNYGQQLKAPSALMRLRLYETLLLLPPQNFESSYTHLLRMLVTEFTLIENPANTTTSLLKNFCHVDHSIILGTLLQETDHRIVEDQLQLHSAAGSGALEHDSCCLYRHSSSNEVPGPLPLGVAVIDTSILLFGQIFPRVANKHRLQMIDHFSECIKHTRSSRQEAIQVNVFTALLSGLKGLNDAKLPIGLEDMRKTTASLITNALTSPNPILRCAAAEAVGRMVQVLSDARFTAELAQASFDRLKSARDVASRTGHSLALGCLHHYVGGMGASQHLNTSVSILLALTQDQSSPVVQMWSLHALALIADSGGPMFRGYFEPTLSLMLKLLLNVSQTYVDVHKCIGKVLCALITTIGPELQSNTPGICDARTSFLSTCAIMQDHLDPLVQAEAIACLQQLHLFAPQHINLSSLVPMLCRALSSSHLLLRKAAISCLRQLTQRESREVCEHAMTLANESKDANSVEGLLITETGLPGVFFSMLDTETDPGLISDIHDTLMSTLQMLAADNLSQWLGLCKDVLTIATENANADDKGNINEENEAEDVEGDDDQARFHTEGNSSQYIIQPKWPTRVFAAQCVRKIISTCESTNKAAHFDLVQAKEGQKSKGKNDYLVLHLSDLIRMAFIAATSISDPLRLEGLKTLQEIIEKFAEVPEPEFPGHLLLEQFQAQVSAALRPAFAPNTSPYITATACEVCSTWIGSNVAKDLNDLKRVHQLMVSSLTKLQNRTSSVELYNESLATLEKLAVLKAWAEVYIVAMKSSSLVACANPQQTNANDIVSHKNENLLTLVQPELFNLSQYWFGALKDHALLSLPSEFMHCLPRDGGMFYTADTMELSKVYYAKSWSSILHAAALWLSMSDFIMHHLENEENNLKCLNNNVIGCSDKFYLLFGVCVQALCGFQSLESLEHTNTCLQALFTMLDSVYGRKLIIVDNSLGIEMCNILHRLILTIDDHVIQILCIDVLKQVMKAIKEQLDNTSELKETLDNDTNVIKNGKYQQANKILPGKSIVFSVLEVCICLLVRQLPTLMPPTNTLIYTLRITQTSDDSGKLIAKSLSCLENLPDLCAPQEAVSILPTILHLTINTIKEIASKKTDNTCVLADEISVKAALHCLKCLTNNAYSREEISYNEWQKLLQSALAKVIDLAKTGNDESKLDEVTTILAIAVFVLYAPSSVVTAPNLLYPCINLFRQYLQSTNNMVQLKCIQTLKSVFTHHDRNLATAFIHALAPILVENLYVHSASAIGSNIKVTIITEIMTVLETLIDMAPSQKRIQMLTLLVPLLIRFLIEEQGIHTGDKYQLQIHEFSLQHLMNIGLKYQQDFKKFMSQAGNLRIKLETAIRNNQQKRTHHKVDTDLNNKSTSNFVPSIKLKTDFSNFL